MNVFIVPEGNLKSDKMCILTSTLTPENLVNVRDRVGSISLHEVVMSQRNDVAKFLLKKSIASLDVEDCMGTSPRRMSLTPVLGASVNDVIRKYVERNRSRRVNGYVERRVLHNQP